MRCRKQAAFTLIELLFTLAVAAILAIVATPAMQHLVARNRLAQTHNRLIGAVNLARTLAITTGTATLLCPSTDGRGCAHTQHWEHGWLVATDADHDFQPDGPPRQVYAAAPAALRVHSSRGRLHLRYQADGSAPGSNLSLIVCRANDSGSARSIVVSNSGRPRPGTASRRQARSCSRS